MFNTFTFESPYFLLLFILFVVFDTLRSEESEALYLPHIAFLKRSKNTHQTWYKVLKWCMILFAVLALGKPIYYSKIQSIKKDAIDIVLALDISGSMGLYGFNPNAYKQTRLDVVKTVVSSFIDKRSHDRIGLVLFGTHASIASPLSFDKTSQKNIVQGLAIGSLGKSTALIDSIVSSVMLLKSSQTPSKVLIILSDGEDSSSKTPLNIALKLSKKYAIKIYTIIIDKSHSDMMDIIAKSSKTKPYLAKTKEDLKHIYKHINQLEKSDIHYATVLVPQALYMYPLGLALLCGFLLLWLRKNRGIV